MPIRPATREDAAAISALIIPLVKTHVAPTCTAQGSELILASMSTLRIEHYLEQGYHYLVYTDHQAVVGVIGLRDNSHLYHLFVADSHSGRGIAHQLWQRVKKEAQARGIKHVTVNAALSAAPLYERWGFIAESGVREQHGVRDIPMSLTL
ncbi:MAG: GNAT family N-acetyltransferase [Pseudomonadales bacterium]